MEEVRDCRGKIVCFADGRTGIIEHKYGKKTITGYYPVGGKVAFNTAYSYTVLERTDSETFYVTSYPN